MRDLPIWDNQAGILLLEVRKAMSLLPTAHAGQSFGARRIDFYTVSGEVSASDDGTGRVTDTDGMTHDVRLLERSNALAPGDTASVLRVQAGPNRRSRPTAIINHTRGTWMRASPEATTLLARSGVTRSFNWWLSVLVLAAVAIASVWPAIHGFLTEVNGGLMASIPAFDVFAEIGAFLPALGGWRLETALPGGLIDGIASLGFVPMEQLTEWGLALGAGVLVLLTFLGRSWRLIYVPALGAFALAAGVILGSSLPTLSIIGGGIAFFMLGGLVNRIRDGGRFNARVARLAEHALRNPPQEGVRSSDGPDGSAVAAGIAASAAIATATAVAQGDAQDDDAETAPDAATEEASHPDSAAGEAEAPPQDDLLPAAAAADTEHHTEAQPAEAGAAGDVEAAPEVEVTPSNTPEAETRSEETETEVAATEFEPDMADTAQIEPETTVESEAETTSENAAVPPEADHGDVTAPEAAPENSAPANDPAEPSDGTEIVIAAEAGSDDASDDDLPSLDAVAAAAALSATEDSAADTPEPAQAATARPSVDLDDERTMPVAPPPPMPGNEAAEAAATTMVSADPESEPAIEPSTDAAQASPVDDSSSSTIIDDPLMDEASDPMVSAEGKADFAPGAPDIELDRAQAE
ncbi:hypothetical protein MACH15_01140 [Maricaulis maris]|nr:hypothetical protein MACH15_01140 [Maricaulis maris]